MRARSSRERGAGLFAERPKRDLIPMNRATVGSRWNLELLEGQYQRWQLDPGSVDESWRAFFEGYELGQMPRAGSGEPVLAQATAPATTTGAAVGDLDAARCQAAVTRMIIAYREIGHYLAHLDPLKLNLPNKSHELLELSEFGLTDNDLDKTFYNRLTAPPHATLRDLLGALQETYCRTIGVEFMHIRDRRIRDWLIERMEPIRNRPSFDRQKKRRILWKLNAAELLETFLHSHYVGQKRFSLEGGEMLIPLLDSLVERAGGTYHVRDIVIGMPHRGRLNVLTNILDKPFGMVFSEFEGNAPRTVAGDGDVKYHLGFSSDRVFPDGHVLHLSLTANPSHLEAVNPVVEGRVRAKQRRYPNKDRRLGLPVLIHGDAAFSGQGLVAETLNLSQLTGYKTGGTVHIVVNNQIGFTTAPSEGRSSRYCTDVAKMIEVPIFHVNGEDPEAVVMVTELALDFRQTFERDVVIDMVCYRKHGHNEGDEPAFTQPVMYSRIKDRPTIKDLFTEHLILGGELTVDDAETIAETFREKLEGVYREVHESEHAPLKVPPVFENRWAGLQPHHSFDPVETGVPFETLRRISEAMARTPEGFHRNPKLDRIFTTRVKTLEAMGAVEWGFAEGLAIGSLLVEGTPVRVSGQDSRRGTFSQRHAVLADLTTGDTYTPLNHIQPDQEGLCIYNSHLSEAAVLGFDYGYALEEPNMLICWEAQFGDFVNGAQVIIDQFIVSAESKWGRASGIVMLLPHGYEGQGPEHSSARIERFLQLCAEENIQVVNASTPAQYFHLLRRQVRRDFRKPLVVFTPKSLLRHKHAVSPVSELVSGHFQDVMDDPAITEPSRVRRIVLCSGKVYYDLIAHRDAVGKTAEVAIVRIEQFYPWPAQQLDRVTDRYPNAREFIWAQEESQNMGGWTFVAPRLRELLGRDVDYVGRDASASPATGSHHVHEREQAELVEAAIGAEGPHLVTATPARLVAAVGANGRD
jgi:2-oxoglutarate dehydrogenase E1 component